ncbi:MAG: hypothetical protein IJA78_02800 [Clostridia bacterium]|nr:hypothetical protein [Clostridia bacterium]
MTRKAAKLVRILTIPPVMVAVLFFALYSERTVFLRTADMIVVFLCLAILPVLAYPLQKLVPAWRAGGRRAQRNLAFVLSVTGYIAAVAYCLLAAVGKNLIYVAVVYLLSVVVLTLWNALTPFHASGHACGIAGPILLICLFIGNWRAIVPGVALFLLALWASLVLKRHDLREFLLGALCSVLTALAVYLLMQPTF